MIKMYITKEGNKQILESTYSEHTNDKANQTTKWYQ